VAGRWLILRCGRSLACVLIRRRPCAWLLCWLPMQRQDLTLDWLSIAEVHRILDEAGIDKAGLVDADPGIHRHQRLGAV
jgi:hypothetical protein